MTYGIRTLVVPTDFSAAAGRAAKRAAWLAREARLPDAFLLHARSDARFTPLRHWFSHGSPWSDTDTETEAAERLIELAASFSRAASIPVRRRVVDGNLIEHIKEIGARTPSMVVLGADMRHPLRRRIASSVIDRIVRLSGVPTLVVKCKPREPYRQVVVAVDLDTCALRAMALARSLAPRAKLRLLHVYRTPFEGQLRLGRVGEAWIESHRLEALDKATAGVQQLVHGSAGDVAGSVVHGHASREIPRIQRTLEADLVVATRRRRRYAGALLDPSVTLRLVERAAADVLVVPEGDRTVN